MSFNGSVLFRPAFATLGCYMPRFRPMLFLLFRSAPVPRPRLSPRHSPRFHTIAVVCRSSRGLFCFAPFPSLFSYRKSVSLRPAITAKLGHCTVPPHGFTCMFSPATASFRNVGTVYRTAPRFFLCRLATVPIPQRWNSVLRAILYTGMFDNKP